ncbi:MAG: hypothetical protein A2X77_03805 [Gammaproteobacteria bacterium GWE2_42_36]|nr:MAG: hypothetical protein A2X77_03805 [Gammaproteobacteria bacterium GWE2_42_36]HCU05043.1 NADH dehydrogenase subunit [Coxiellaceae bacterium]
MFERQEIVTIDRSELMSQSQRLSKEGYRLVQISCTKKADHFQLDYTFDKAYQFYNLRLSIALEEPSLPSISHIFMPAFLYENELHDLFGIKVSDMLLDYQGKFYNIAQAAPFSTLATTTVETQKG